MLYEVITDLNSQQTETIAGISIKYASLFEPKINDKYIVYLDCKDEYGGAVCGYDRAAGESFVMREYLYVITSYSIHYTKLYDMD